MIDSKATASIDQSVRMPDYFDCHNCIAWKGYYLYLPNHPMATKSGDVNMCYILQDQGACAKQILANAINSGSVQIVLHLSAGK